MPIEVVGHKDPKAKGDQGLNSGESSFILVALGDCILLDIVSHQNNFNGKIATSIHYKSAQPYTAF